MGARKSGFSAIAENIHAEGGLILLELLGRELHISGQKVALGAIAPGRLQRFLELLQMMLDQSLHQLGLAWKIVEQATLGDTGTLSDRIQRQIARARLAGDVGRRSQDLFAGIRSWFLHLCRP